MAMTKEDFVRDVLPISSFPPFLSKKPQMQPCGSPSTLGSSSKAGNWGVDAVNPPVSVDAIAERRFWAVLSVSDILSASLCKESYVVSWA